MMESPLMAKKIEDACESKRLQNMYAIDVENATLKVFEQLNYTPSPKIKFHIDKTWVNSNRNDTLAEFIYNVWRIDAGES